MVAACALLAKAPNAASARSAGSVLLLITVMLLTRYRCHDEAALEPRGETRNRR